MSGTTSSAALAGLRILVAEDEAVLAMVMEDAIVAAGGSVLGPPASVADALGLLQTAMMNDGVHAVVLNVKVDRGGGLAIADVCQTLGIRFLFATSYAREDLAGRHPEAPLLEKPFGPDELVKGLGGLVTEFAGAPSYSARKRK